ncbi:MAG: SUMF1/EgtB/PvdO family nonheme iron enzyme [Sandaracinaceae bacterium]|nr:SUMF1/EgtB/PvdO family nonheme iron enzyme [Sandaracinaceae bacterium]
MGRFSFCIDRHEALIRNGIAEPAFNDLPAVGVSYEEALEACKKAGYRLCTRKEWTRACRGPKGRRFPYGDHWEPHRCNAIEAEDNPSAHSIRPSGSFPLCVTEEGVYDLSGNVWEWTSEADASGTLREIRGGSVHNGEEEAECEAEDRVFLPIQTKEGLHGFRCCASPWR